MMSLKDSKNAAVKHVAEKCKPVPDVTQRVGTSVHSRPEQMSPKNESLYPTNDVKTTSFQGRGNS